MRRSTAKRLLVPVMLCCNDDNGVDAGKLFKIEFGEHLSLDTTTCGPDWELDGPKLEWNFRSKSNFNSKRWKAYRCRGSLTIARRSFEFRAYRPHVGNIFWDLILMPQREVLRLIRWLRRKDWFQFDAGLDPWWDIWRTRRQIKRTDVLEIAKAGWKP